MQNQRAMGFGLLLVMASISFVWAKSAVIVGMVTETHGAAYWQNDGKKAAIQELAELPLDSKLVLSKGSKLAIVYMTSGQQYELLGPSLVQFKNDQPIALNGPLPRKVGAAVLSENKIRIEPKKVQTAGQNLVSTEKSGLKDMPVASAPPPPPPVAPAPSPIQLPFVTPSDVAASSSASMNVGEYEAERMALARAIAVREAEVAASQAETESAAARSAVAADAVKSEGGCQPTKATDKKEQTGKEKPKKTEAVVPDCSMITF